MRTTDSQHSSTSAIVGSVASSILIVLGGVLLREDIIIYRLSRIELPQNVQNEALENFKELVHGRRHLIKMQENFMKESNSLLGRNNLTAYKKRVKRYKEVEIPAHNATIDVLKKKVDDLAKKYAPIHFRGDLQKSRDYFNLWSLNTEKRSVLSRAFNLDTYSANEYLWHPREDEASKIELRSMKSSGLSKVSDSPRPVHSPVSNDPPPVRSPVSYDPPPVRSPESLELRQRVTAKVKTRGVPGPEFQQPLQPEQAEQEPLLHRVQPPYTVLSGRGQEIFQYMKQNRYRNIDYFTVRDFLENEGFGIVRQRGSHVVFYKANGNYKVVVPVHETLKVGTLRNGILGERGLRIPEVTT